MLNNNTNHVIPQKLAVYSARKLQFAIRLGLRPTPEVLREIIKSKPSKKNEISLFINQFPPV